MTKRTGLKVGLVATLGIVAICAGIVAWFLFARGIRGRFNRQGFEPIGWQSGQSLTNAIRIRMVDDLLHRHRLRDMTR